MSVKAFALRKQTSKHRATHRISSGWGHACEENERAHAGNACRAARMAGARLGSGASALGQQALERHLGNGDLTCARTKLTFADELQLSA